jgi:hypothetical protein
MEDFHGFRPLSAEKNLTTTVVLFKIPPAGSNTCRRLPTEGTLAFEHWLLVVPCKGKVSTTPTPLTFQVFAGVRVVVAKPNTPLCVLHCLHGTSWLVRLCLVVGGFCSDLFVHDEPPFR